MVSDIYKIKKHVKNNFIKKNKSKKFIPGKTKIPIASPPYASDEIIEALDSMLTMQTSMGKKVGIFEKKFAKYINRRFSVMVNSGSSANLLALSILTNPELGNKRIRKGDEIITPAVTWPTTVYPIVDVGATPHFVDVKLDDFNIDPKKIEEAITKKTKAIMFVHLLGCPCDMTKIKKIARKNNLWLIEDTCEAHGAKYGKRYAGSFGDISTFSFYASHHITTMEGGMILTNDKKLFELGKSLRAFGWTRDQSNRREIEKKYSTIDPHFLFTNMGFNMKPTELQGAFGIHQIKKLETLVKLRISNAKYWNARLEKFRDFLILPTFRKKYRNSFLFYPITVIENGYFRKDELVKHLEKNNIQTRPIVAGNMVQQPSTKFFNFKRNNTLKNSEYIMRNSFGIGNHHEIKNAERKYVADVINNFINQKISH
jgi:CDP-6-deoxy-D-xylo-4-hexulose-3-dehydrase